MTDVYVTGKKWSTVHANWMRVEDTACWLEDTVAHCILIGGECSSGLHSCSCWTEPAFIQETDTSLAGTRGHSPLLFCQHHTIAILQIIWEDLSGKIKVGYDITFQGSHKLPQLARANIYNDNPSCSQTCFKFRCGWSTNFQWRNSVTLVFRNICPCRFRNGFKLVMGICQSCS